MIKCLTFLSVSALLFMSLTACEPSSTTSSTSSSETTNTASCDASKLVGLWSGNNYSMQIMSDMTYRASGTPNMSQIDVTGTIKVDKCKVTITDNSGKYACPSDEVGTYNFVVTDSTLDFDAVTDACEGRKTPLNAGTLTKK